MNKKVVVAILIIFWLLFLAGNVSASFSSKTLSKTIFLTFDADMTYHMQRQQKTGLIKKWYDPALIEYLEKNNIPATFFVTGMFAEMYPDLIKRIAANSNFSIQNHTYDHRSFEPNCFHLPFVRTVQQKKTEIRRTQNILKSLIGHTPVYFRYPGLCHNAHDDALVASEGLSLVQGEIISGDAYMKKPEAIVNNALRGLDPGSAIIFHLGTVKTPETLNAVKLLVPQLKKLGYTLGHL